MSAQTLTAYRTSAKHDSHCTRCNKPIRKGDRIVYVPATRRAFCRKKKHNRETCGDEVYRALRPAHLPPEQEED